MHFLCAKHVTIVSQVFFIRTLGGAAVIHILQRKKLTYIELKYLFHGQHVAGSCLGPKPSGFRVHTVSHSLSVLLLKNVRLC